MTRSARPFALPSRRWALAWPAVMALVTALVVVAGLAAQRQAERVFLDDTARRGDTTLRLAVASLQGQLDRFERLPRLIAENPLMRRLAADPDNPVLVAESNRYLKGIATTLGASDVYLMDLGGTTRAASNFDTATSFVGGNFAFRPYFTEAISKGDGRFFALGTTSAKRGFYFGAPVRSVADITGVLVFKIDLDAIEETWAGGDDQIIVTDPEGIVFLSSREDWLFRPLATLTPDQKARTATTRRYANRDLDQPPLVLAENRDERRLVTVAGQTGPRALMKLSLDMAGADWTVSVLLDTAPAGRQAVTVALAAMLALGLGSMAGAAVFQRRARLRERLELQQSARVELERRVRERTAELAAVNMRLEAEVAERIAAERDLRQAQSDLIQAGKLAALGQMSAALSHEFNQPLAATRTYADNALVLIDRDRIPEARGNIARILSLIDRMAELSRHLRNFARKPGTKPGIVALPDVVAAAAEIAGPRLRAADAALEVDLPADLPPVVAGPVRLEQVLVNIITNAADAVDGLPDRRIHLAARPTPEGARITLRDHGPGVPQALHERIFDPFFSTKGVGKGLGLGLSISYNIIKDFGGDLTVADAPGGGALFVIDLRRADPAESRAA